MENFGDHFVVPDLGPIGISGGLAHPRHFVAPEALEEGLGVNFHVSQSLVEDIYLYIYMFLGL